MNNKTNKNIGEQQYKKRLNRLHVIYVLSALVGVPFGILIGRVEKGTLSLNPVLLIGLMLIFTIAFFYLTWIWYKSMDEFESNAFNKAGNLALHTGFIALPWFILHKQGILPPLDGAFLMVGMSIVFCIVYIFKKGSL